MKKFWQSHFNSVKEIIYQIVERVAVGSQPRWMKGITAVFATHMIVSINLISILCFHAQYYIKYNIISICFSVCGKKRKSLNFWIMPHLWLILHITRCTFKPIFKNLNDTVFGKSAKLLSTTIHEKSTWP